MMAASKRLWRAGVLAGFAVAWCGAARAESCSPEQLMAKVATFSDLLEHKMQAPLASRRAAAARIKGVMKRHQAAPTGYDGVCEAYDDLIDQLRR